MEYFLLVFMMFLRFAGLFLIYPLFVMARIPMKRKPQKMISKKMILNKMNGAQWQ